jgi:S-adenosylmethionine decarboxylase
MYCDDFTMKISNLSFDYIVANSVNELMESKGGKKKSSSSSSKSSLFYEAPLGYSIEDIRPNGGIKKFRSAAYSNVSVLSFE